jgi:peptidyl-prolyl cis-trans isomerase SurA
VPTEARYAASQVLVAWNGAVNAPPSVQRSEDEARAVAETARARILAGEDFAAVARALSDSPTGKRGGSLGTYNTGTLVPEVESAVAGLEIGGVSEPVRSPFGWHVLRRDAIVERRASHVLVAFQGAERSQVFRSRDEARARIDDALRRIEAGEDFATVAREMSDDPSASLGGDIGRVARGQMVPAFEDALFALESGAHSGVVETPYGYHVVLRTE